MSIHIRDVSKMYKGYDGKKFYALKNINLYVDAGKCLALIGQNGAGKTTLIKCLISLISPDSGAIEIDGMKMGQMIKENKLGYMPEIVEGLDKITGNQYITQMMTLRGIDKKEYVERLNYYIEKLSLGKYMNIPMGHCSKGNYKKILFLQAIIHEPRCLILDEPTDGVDPISRRELLSIINEIKYAGNMVIITTHLLSDIERVADKIAILKDGMLLEEIGREKLEGSVEDWYINLIQTYGDQFEISENNKI